jgi:chemotaxis protein methyltransferase CheR
MNLNGRGQTDVGRGNVTAPMSDADFSAFASLIHAKTGIVINEAKRSMLVSRLSRRLRDFGLPDFQSYRDLLDSRAGAEEHGAFISAITTNVTSFFREPGHFEALANMVPGLASRAATGERIRIWSAGCSSGEEPYSIAMTLKENWPTIMARPTSGSLQPTSIPAWSLRPAAVSIPHSRWGTRPLPPF